MMLAYFWPFWRKPASIPKDGTFVLIRLSSERIPFAIGAWYSDTEYEDDIDWLDQNGSPVMYEPEEKIIGWMPLPRG